MVVNSILYHPQRSINLRVHLDVHDKRADQADYVELSIPLVNRHALLTFNYDSLVLEISKHDLDHNGKETFHHQIS